MVIPLSEKFDAIKASAFSKCYRASIHIDDLRRILDLCQIRSVSLFSPY